MFIKCELHLQPRGPVCQGPLDWHEARLSEGAGQRGVLDAEDVEHRHARCRCGVAQLITPRLCADRRKNARLRAEFYLGDLYAELPAHFLLEATKYFSEAFTEIYFLCTTRACRGAACSRI